MKNVLIFLSLLTIVLLAVLDAKERMRELDSIAGKTPAQVEMKENINKPIRDVIKDSSDAGVSSHTTSQNLYNDKVKEQQSNNIPQQMQPNPLQIKN